MFYKEHVIQLNKKIDKGNLVNECSLEFALSSIKTKSWIDQIAYIVRALLLDHIFEDGNKRTAALVIGAYYTTYKIGFDPDKIAECVLTIASKNIREIPKIKRMIKNVIR